MLSAAGDTTTKSTDLLTSTLQLAKRLVELQNQGASAELINEVESQLAEKLNQQPFEIKEQIPFFQQAVRKLDTSALQSFRLPGSERVVVDRRDEAFGKPEIPEKKDAGESLKELRLQEGKLVKEKERAFTDRLTKKDAAGFLERRAAADRVERLLSSFEKMVIARFEDGRQIAKENLEGQTRFLPKTEAQWKEFFKAFLHRTVQKKVLLSEIRDFLLRGLITKGEKGIVISDMRLASGRVEKFIRFSILAEALAKLKALVPGDAFGKGALGSMSGEELVFLALAASRGRDFQTSPLPSQGKFLGGKAEAEAARMLGIPIETQLKQKAQSLRTKKGGIFTGFGEEGASDRLPYQFIPWWRWGNLKKPGKSKWVTAAFYGTLFILAFIGIAALTYRLLNGG